MTKLYTDENPTRKYVDGIPAAHSIEDAWFNLLEAITDDNPVFKEKKYSKKS